MLAVDTDLSNLKDGCGFPSYSNCIRIASYKLNEDRFSGDYANAKKFGVISDTGEQKYVAWQPFKINKFKQYTNKMLSIVFNRDPVIKTGNSSRDDLVRKLVETTGWFNGIREAFGNMEKYGNAPMKTYLNGVSAFKPYNAYKVVDSNDVKKVICYVLFQYILEGNKAEYVRFECHFKGYVYECAFEYTGTCLGKQVSIVYNGTTIPADGNYIETGLDEFMVQWLMIDSVDGVYGLSPYEDFAMLVHEAEKRQMLNSRILDAHSCPTMAVAMGTLKHTEYTQDPYNSDARGISGLGNYSAERGAGVNTPMGKVIEIPNGQNKPEYITWDGKLDSSEKMLETLFSEIYEMSELGKTFMTGEYSGNISDDTLNSLIKSAIDKGNRHVWDVYYDMVKSLYVLCKLNGIDVNIGDITIDFGVGSGNNEKEKAEIISNRISSGTMSVKRVLTDIDGMSEDEADAEIKRISEERGSKDEKIG